MTYEEQNLLVDSVCTDVTALAMVGANVREAPDTVLESFRPKGLQLYLLRNIDTAILVLARAKSIPIYALATREAVLWTRSSRGTVNSICGWGWTTAVYAERSVVGIPVRLWAKCRPRISGGAVDS